LVDTKRENGGTKEDEQWHTKEQEWWSQRTNKFLKTKSGERKGGGRSNGGGMRARE